MILRVVLVLLLVTGHGLAAQEYSPQEETSTARKGAICFSFNGLVLRGFEGGIGVKSWVSSRTALVAGVEFYHTSIDEEYEDDTNRLDREMTRTLTGVSLGFQRHSRVGSKLSPYVGFDLGTGMLYARSSYMYPEDSDLGEYERTRDEYYVSGNVSLGIEYFIANDISLSGQHSFEVSYSFGTEQAGYGGDDGEAELSGLSIGLGTSQLILSIYL
jgi:hypothetical protein